MSKLNKTRKELIDLRSRREVATEGKGLLKDRIGALNRRLSKQAYEVYSTRVELEQELSDAYRLLGKSIAQERNELIEQALQPPIELEAIVDTENIMGVEVSTVEITKEMDNLPVSNTPLLDQLRDNFTALIEMIAELANEENYLEKISQELRKTRQRFNALDQKVIPDIQESIKDIEIYLEEREQEEQYKQREWR